MPSHATIILHKEEASLDARVAALTRFFGIECRVIPLAGDGRQSEDLQSNQPSACLMVSATSLAAILQDETIAEGRAARLFEQAEFVLVYGITAGHNETSAVKTITGGVITSIRRFTESNHSYEVNTRRREITGEFTGLKFGPIKNQTDCGLVTDNADQRLSELVTIAGLPFFASIQRNQSELYLVASGDVADLQATTDTSLYARDNFSRIMPVLMFLRHVFGDQTWHNTSRLANFIIDDPLLRKTYGFLNYRQLLAEMDRTRFTSTIAFIPWNYKRTNHAIARLVRDRADRFSVCVHGCDHTGGEFSSTDVADLNRRVGLAIERMRAHEQRTGVPSDDVMVFPQGRFSSVSLSVLKKHNYLAAVNSTVKPLDLGDAHGITLRELLQPAVSRFAGFPLFMRRYPREPADFAFDLFLGKPALVVEHHGYFKDGYGKVRDFMGQLNGLTPALEWMGLGELLTQTYMQRRVAAGIVECKIFVNHQVIKNSDSTTTHFVILKQEEDTASIEEITVDGRSHPYVFENGYIRLSVDIPGLSTARIKISYARPLPNSNNGHRQSVMGEFKVYLRRHLSEARDNYLAKHPKVLALAYRVKNGKSDTE
jgi:hypothetical protein